MSVSINLACEVLCGDDPVNQVTYLGAQIHRDMLPSYKALEARASDQGFELAIASGYRSFDRQLGIWNAKARGERPILDDGGQPIARASLSDKEAVYAILRWSALPGGSRHHWGTDIDVIDRAALPEGYSVQLTVEETTSGGVFAPFHQWLSSHLSTEDTGFYRPYPMDAGGVACEPWHLSYAPLAKQYQKQLTLEVLYARIERADMALKPKVLKHLKDIYQRFVCVE